MSKMDDVFIFGAALIMLVSVIFMLLLPEEKRIGELGILTALFFLFLDMLYQRRRV